MFLGPTGSAWRYYIVGGFFYFSERKSFVLWVGRFGRIHAPFHGISISSLLFSKVIIRLGPFVIYI